jgi:hypothetical protein
MKHFYPRNIWQFIGNSFLSRFKVVLCGIQLNLNETWQVTLPCIDLDINSANRSFFCFEHTNCRTDRRKLFAKVPVKINFLYPSILSDHRSPKGGGWSSPHITDLGQQAGKFQHHAWFSFTPWDMALSQFFHSFRFPFNSPRHNDMAEVGSEYPRIQCNNFYTQCSFLSSVSCVYIVACDFLVRMRATCPNNLLYYYCYYWLTKSNCFST